MRVIFHIDMDAFFAAVETLCRPQLAGKPVMVCGDPDTRSVVAAASYPAREYGIHSGMPTPVAKRLCPDGIFLAGDPEKYVSVSLQLNALFRRFSPCVESFSIDESFLDMTETHHLYGGAVSAAHQIKRAIRREFGLTASIGVGPNKLLAKMASKMEKPDGLTILGPEELDRAFVPLPVDKLFGIGEQTRQKLEVLGVRTIGDLARTPKATLEKLFGVVGELLHEAAHGRDSSPVVPDAEQPPPKSVGNSYTLLRDTRTWDTLSRVLQGLCLKVARRLREGHHAGRTVTVTLRFADFTTITRAATSGRYLDLDREIFELARQIFLDAWQDEEIRLLGVSVSNLVHSARERQLPLFGYRYWRKYHDLLATVDALRDRYGERVVTWASLLKMKGRSE